MPGRGPPTLHRDCTIQSSQNELHVSQYVAYTGVRYLFITTTFKFQSKKTLFFPAIRLAQHFFIFPHKKQVTLFYLLVTS
jgi:hypothetical protein